MHGTVFYLYLCYVILNQPLIQNIKIMKTKIYSLLAITLFLLTAVVVFKTTNDSDRSISGKVVESYGTEAIENALVTVSQKGKVIAKTFVNEDGSFEIKNLPKEVVEFTIENVSYHCYSKSIDLSTNKKFNLGTIGLSFVENVLEEIIINVNRKI